MPISNRPYEADGNSIGRRAFRTFTDFKRSSRSNGNGKGTKPAPPEVTNAENFYYVKQMNSKTPMVIVLKDGEELEGVIEWYDKCSIKVNRDNGPNLLVYKSVIKYMYKAE